MTDFCLLDQNIINLIFRFSLSCLCCEHRHSLPQPLSLIFNFSHFTIVY